MEIVSRVRAPSIDAKLARERPSSVPRGVTSRITAPR
jgi:hypothetical protein